ncbi:hypothetical protein QX776_10760 [Alteromonadaceae bacterium BrNp21-10]|nr:hypothetical protein [Alteromonadaceae bacterium BrNp21-10]
MRKIVTFLVGVLTVTQNLAATTMNKQASPLELSAKALYSDNINPTNDADNGASVLALAANGQFTQHIDGWWWQLDYAAQTEKLQLDSDDVTQTDSYQQGHIGIVSRWYLGKAWYLDAGAKVQQQDERIGSGLSQLRRDIVIADSRRSDEYHAELVYGQDVSSRNLTLSYTHKNLDYADNNSYSNLFDINQQTIAAHFTFAMSSASRFVLFLEHQQDNYDVASRVDSRMQRAMVGMDWQPSGTSSLSILVGQYQRQPQGGDATHGVTWQMSYQYAPRDGLQTTITSSKSSVAGENELASDSLRQQWQINMHYLYSDQWHYGWQGQFSHTDYLEQTASRSITVRNLSLWMKLNLRDYQHVVLDIGHRQSDESTGLFDYQQNEVSISWQYEF